MTVSSQCQESAKKGSSSRSKANEANKKYDHPIHSSLITTKNKASFLTKLNKAMMKINEEPASVG